MKNLYWFCYWFRPYKKDVFIGSTVKRYSILYRQEFEKFLIQRKFPLELLEPAQQPMAGPSSSKGIFVEWETFQILGGMIYCISLLWLDKDVLQQLSFLDNN